LFYTELNISYISIFPVYLEILRGKVVLGQVSFWVLLCSSLSMAQTMARSYSLM